MSKGNSDGNNVLRRFHLNVAKSFGNLRCNGQNCGCSGPRSVQDTHCGMGTGALHNEAHAMVQDLFDWDELFLWESSNELSGR